MAIDRVTGARLPVDEEGNAIIQCDSLGCLNGVSTGVKRRDVAREIASEKGWAVVDGHDFCPMHIDIHPELWPPGKRRDLPTRDRGDGVGEQDA